MLLEIFYPDSRGVNVFVGGAKTPDMALKLVRGESPGGEFGGQNPGRVLQVGTSKKRCEKNYTKTQWVDSLVGFLQGCWCICFTRCICWVIFDAYVRDFDVSVVYCNN